MVDQHIQAQLGIFYGAAALEKCAKANERGNGLPAT